MSPSSFLRLIVSQATILRRNTIFWLASLIAAVVSMAVFGWLFNPDTRPFDLAVVDQDGSEASQALVSAFDSVDNVNVSHGSREDELASLDEGDLAALVVIPAAFGDDLAAGDAAIPVYYDDSDPVRTGYASNTVDAVIDAYSDEFLARPDALRVEEQSVSTEGVSYIDFLTPGMVGLTVMWVNLGVAFLLVTWREQGILRRLGVTPLRPGGLILTQALSFALISVTQVIIILSMGRFIFDVQINGSLLWLAVTVGLGVAAMLALGYLIASLLRSATSVNAVVNMVTFPMIFLGGSYFPLEPPAALNPLVQAIPLTHLNEALREVVNGSGDLADLWPQWAALSVWAIAGFLLSFRLFRWQ
ncbi:MAG: ABC transporter permease [Dehalococcoidia bacterium]